MRNLLQVQGRAASHVNLPLAVHSSSFLSILSFNDIPNYHYNEKDVALVLIFIGMLSNQKYFFTLSNTFLKTNLLKLRITVVFMIKSEAHHITCKVSDK